MKQKIILAGIIFLMIIVPFLHISSAMMEQPKYEKGDYWEYSYKVIDYVGNATRNVREGVAHEELIEEKKVSIDNTSYNVLVIKTVPIETSLPGENSTWVIEYYNSSDLSLLEAIEPFNSSSNLTFFYKPPLKKFSYPLYVGKEWESRGEAIVCGPYNKWKQNFSYHYTCTGKEDIKVPAGKFSCYVIKRDGKTNKDTYTLYYLSPEAGNEVKELSYIDGKLIREKVLISFHYRGGGREERKPIPNFEFLLLLKGMTILILIKRYFTNKS